MKMNKKVLDIFIILVILGGIGLVVGMVYNVKHLPVVAESDDTDDDVVDMSDEEPQESTDEELTGHILQSEIQYDEDNDLDDVESITNIFKDNRYLNYTIDLRNSEFKSIDATLLQTIKDDKHYVYIFKTKDRTLALNETDYSFKKILKESKKTYKDVSGEKPYYSESSSDGINVDSLIATEDFDVLVDNNDEEVGCVAYNKIHNVDENQEPTTTDLQIILIQKTTDDTRPLKYECLVKDIDKHKVTYTDMRKSITELKDNVSVASESVIKGKIQDGVITEKDIKKVDYTKKTK